MRICCIHAEAFGTHCATNVFKKPVARDEQQTPAHSTRVVFVPRAGAGHVAFLCISLNAPWQQMAARERVGRRRRMSARRIGVGAGSEAHIYRHRSPERPLTRAAATAGRHQGHGSEAGRAGGNADGCPPRPPHTRHEAHPQARGGRRPLRGPLRPQPAPRPRGPRHSGRRCGALRGIYKTPMHAWVRMSLRDWSSAFCSLGSVGYGVCPLYPIIDILDRAQVLPQKAHPTLHAS